MFGGLSSLITVGSIAAPDAIPVMSPVVYGRKLRNGSTSSASSRSTTVTPTFIVAW